MLKLSPSSQSAFQRHLSFFARDPARPNHISLRNSLRGNLALSLNFLASLILAAGQRLLYGNVGPLYMSPFRAVDVARTSSSRTQLAGIAASKANGAGWTRRRLLEALNARGGGVSNWISLFGLWTLAADTVSYEDLDLYQEGLLLPELEKRRRVGLEEVLPFLKGRSRVGNRAFVAC